MFLTYNHPLNKCDCEQNLQTKSLGYKYKWYNFWLQKRDISYIGVNDKLIKTLKILILEYSTFLFTYFHAPLHKPYLDAKKRSHVNLIALYG